MDNKAIKKILSSKKSKKNLLKFTRNTNSYKFNNVKNYNKLKPYTYSILLKDTIVKTVINNKLENKIKLKRGDYVICGPKNEKYGLPLEKVLNTYDLSPIENKKVIRYGFKLSKKNCGFNKKKIEIIPSWGGVQNLTMDDYILLELDNKTYYGIEQGAFKKSYKLIQ